MTALPAHGVSAPPEPQCGALLFRVTLKSVANSPSQLISLEIPRWSDLLPAGNILAS